MNARPGHAHLDERVDGMRHHRHLAQIALGMLAAAIAIVVIAGVWQ